MANRIKSESDLVDAIDKEMAWRRMELLNLKSFLFKNKKQKTANVLVSALVVLSYSHWEGFVKKSAEYYLNYIQFKDFAQVDLSEELRASIINWIDKTNPIERMKFFKDFLANPNQKIKFKTNKMIDAESNLNSEVLEKILYNIGLPTNEFETKSLFIDKNLLKYRNDIAHGDKHGLKPENAIEVCEKVLEIMDLFKTHLENAIALKSYKNAVKY